MKDKEALCLQLRNRTTRQEETYCKIYTKKFRGYIRSLFLNYQMVGVFIMMVLDSLLLYFTKAWQDEDKMGFYIGATIFAICFIWWIYSAIKGLWFWKYAKYVVVTNEGIWIMVYSVFWWSKDFTGKKRFLSPDWSVYGWGEIKITDDDKNKSDNLLKTMNFFEKFDYAVVKSTHLSTLFITRFDGMQEIDFLEKTDADEILAFAREQHKRKKRKKKDMEIITEEYDVLPDEEYKEDDTD